MARSIRVVAAVVEEDGKYLITQRRPEAVLPLLWEFPGGRVEAGESDERALRRELAERLQIDDVILSGEPLATRSHDYHGYTVVLAIYAAKLGQMRPRRGHINAFRWVGPAELGDYQFPPADQATMDRLLGLTAGRSAS